MLDHCHVTGHVRAVLHRGCNSRMGKLENHKTWAYNGLYGVSVISFTEGCLEYFKKDFSNNPLHPTFYTPEEMKERSKAKAKRKRVAAKKAKEA